jgi:hypothetical protein
MNRNKKLQGTEFIICAAVKRRNRVWYGHRHNNCFAAMNEELSYSLSRIEIMRVNQVQGFVTSTGRFVDRKEAMDIFDPKRLRNLGDELFSEDLY